MVKPHPAEFDGDRNRTKRSRQDNLKDWVTNLVKQQSDVVVSATTKTERIEKRLAKKRRVDEVKNKVRNKTIATPVIDTNDFDEVQTVAQDVNEPTLNNYSANYRQSLSLSTHYSRTQLDKFSTQLERCLDTIKERRKSWQKPYVPVPLISNNTSKRRRQQIANNMENWFQPRRSNYGGIGLARPSLFLTFDDPSWQAKLEEEFLEHVPGFYGKQRTKAMKKQLDGQMLWRQLQKQKLTGRTTTITSKKPNQLVIGDKKLSRLNPDERVEAMIRAGYI